MSLQEYQRHLKALVAAFDLLESGIKQDRKTVDAVFRFSTAKIQKAKPKL